MGLRLSIHYNLCKTYRAIRKTKRELLAAENTNDEEQFTAKSVLLRRQKEEYNKFSKAAGLQTENDRTQPAGFGRSQASKAVWSGKKATYVTETERKSKLGNPNSVNFDVINSAEYRKKFDGISGNTVTDNLICQKSRDILTHRNNSYCEDMYLIDTVSQRVVGVQTHSMLLQEVVYNGSLKSALKKHPPNTLISIHNHPESKPPSGSDFYSCGIRKYKKGIICCHNGDVYIYQTGKKPFTSDLFDKTVDKYKRMPYNMNEKDAYITTLKQFEKNYGIKWEMR